MVNDIKETWHWQRCYKLTKKISAPLKMISLSMFLFFRVNRQSQFLVLSNCWDVMGYCLSEKQLSPFIRDIIKESVQGKISIHLWPNDYQDPLLSKLHQLRIGNGISLSLHFGDYVDIFSFGAEIDNQAMRSFYINHVQLLKRYVIYFRMQAKHMIHEVYCNKMMGLKEEIIFCRNCANSVCEELSQFSKDILPKKIVIQHNEQEINLSYRETTCLLLMLEGKSMKSIANSLGISPKTVDALIQRVKWKTGCRTKVNLLAFLLDEKTDSGVY